MYDNSSICRCAGWLWLCVGSSYQGIRSKGTGRGMYKQCSSGNLLTVSGRQCKQIDWLGAVLVIAGSCLLLLGLNWGGVEYQWLSLPVLATLIAGLTVFAAFSCWEASRWAVLPIIPMRFFLNRTAVGTFEVDAKVQQSDRLQ